MNFVIPLCKIDVERRLIIGRAAQEVADRSKEIMDYETAVPAFQKWSNDFSEATGGLSKGNLRVMHGKSVAGKIVDISFDDATKSIDVVAKVVDDNEWKKCLEGVYTGFSVGGGYGKKWSDGDLTRYTPIVNELSLVDRPCIETALFAELVKADGIIEQLELRGAPIASFAAVWDARPRSFGELLKAEKASAAALAADAEANRPRSFNELMKWNETQQPRDSSGKFGVNAAAAAAGAHA